MEVYNSAMMELSPQAIKLGRVHDQVRVMGENIVIDLHDRAVALSIQADEKAHCTIKDANVALQV
jgi:hypothetical protein